MQDILVFWAQRKIPVDLHFIVRLLLRLEDVASVAPSRKVQLLHLSTQVSLRPVPVAGLCGPGVTCFPVGLPSGAGGQVYLSWLYPPYGHVCDDRLRFDPLDRSM